MYKRQGYHTKMNCNPNTIVSNFVSVYCMVVALQFVMLLKSNLLTTYKVTATLKSRVRIVGAVCVCARLREYVHERIAQS